MLTKKDILIILVLILTFWCLLWNRKPDIFIYRFDPSLVERYMKSQDIYERIDGRIFISDTDIYLATGYLYAQGADPTKYNFPHPPLVKYLFGFAAKYWGNPFIVQLVFSAGLIFLTYFFGLKMSKNRVTPLLATVFLIFDPVFADVSAEAFLDLGANVFTLGYAVLTLFFPGLFILQGMFLGLAAASKFWSPLVLLIAFLYLYQRFILKLKINHKHLTYSLVVAFAVYSLTYLKAFIDRGGAFNIIFFQLKMLKLMIQHNSATMLGGTLVLFLTGHYFKWWESAVLTKASIWSALWPVSLVAIVSRFKYWLKPNIESVVFLYPLFYFLTTFTQVPFTRYFIAVLPFVYLALSATLYKIIIKR